MFVYEMIRINILVIKKLVKMKTTTAKFKMIAAFLLFAGLSITALSWQDPKNQVKKGNPVITDTLPDNKLNIEIDMKGLDEAMKELGTEMQKINIELKNIDWEKISKEVSQSLKELDLNKIQLEVSKSLKEVDWDKISKEVKESLSKVDMDKIKLEIEKAMSEVKNVNMEELKKELDNVKKELEENKLNIKVNVEKELEKAREEIKKAKVELTETKEMINEMEKDGLINKNQGFTIEVKDKMLYINDKKQSAEISAKYSKYIKSENFKISHRP